MYLEVSASSVEQKLSASLLLQDSKLFSSLIATSVFPKGVLERPKLLDCRTSLYAALNMTTTCQQLAYGSDPVHGSPISKAEGLRYIISFLTSTVSLSSSKEPDLFADLRISLDHTHVHLKSCAVSETFLNEFIYFSLMFQDIPFSEYSRQPTTECSLVTRKERNAGADSPPLHGIGPWSPCWMVSSGQGKNQPHQH